ncbi:MAG: SusC/RagA family TonB-linked outer membrane protein [Bacteroidota bacterium]
MKKLLLVFALVVLGVSVSFAQQRTISGTITDDTGEALIGASVLEKGTTNGTVTDLDGKYSITVSSGDAVLVISYTGYASYEATIGASNIVDVALQTGVTLETAVVTALGIEKDKKALGYSVESAKGDALVTAQEANLVNSLAGKFSGVQVTNSGGQAGSSSRIVIRGVSSFLSNNQPLFVIDGVPVDNTQTFGGGQNNTNGTGQGDSPLFFGGTTNRIMDIDPSTIEEVSVLKGASATALYGSRAANGVILITTKSGSQGAKPRITYGFTYGQSDAILPEFQTKYAQGLNGAYRSGLPDGIRGSTSWGPRLDTLTLNAEGEYDPNGTLAPTFNNPDDFFRNGRNIEHQLSISGGGTNSSYFFSYGRKNEEGIVLNNELTRDNFLSKISYTLSEKLSMTASINYIRTDLSNATEGNGLQSFLWTVYGAPNSYNLRGESDTDYLNTDGTQRLYRTNRNNPYFLVDNNGLQSTVNRFLPNVSLTYQLTPWLTLTNRLGGDFFTDNRDYVEVNGTIGTFPTGRVYKDVIDNRQVNNDLILQTSYDVNDDFNLDFLVGSQINDRYSKRLFTQGADLSVPEFQNISNASVLTAVENITNRRLFGVYGQVGASYKGYAYLTLTARNDWSSTLPLDNNSFFYPSAAASFVLTEAIPSLQNHPVWSFIKVRVGWAQVGNDAPPYSTQEALYTQSSVGDGQRGNIVFPFNGQNGFTVSNVIGNPNLKPELTTEQEVGLEVQLFNGRLKLESSYYNRVTDDQIFNAPVAASAGAISRLVNAGSLRNEGVEVLLEGTPLRLGNFEWNLGFNWTRNVNTVEELTMGVENIRLGGFTSPGIYIVRDQGYGVIWGTRYERNDAGQVIIDSDPSSGTYGLPAGLENDLGVIGNTQPDWLAGGRTSFSYGNDNMGRIAVSAVVDVRKGGDILNLDNFYMNFYGVTKATEVREGRYIDANDPTQGIEGPGFIYPNSILDNGGENTIQVPYNETYWRSNWGFAQEEWVEDGSFIRLREVTIGYQLPKTLTDRMSIGDVSVRLSGRNLILHAPNFSGSDPETSLYGSANGQGFYNFITPATRSWNIAVNVGF